MVQREFWFKLTTNSATIFDFRAALESDEAENQKMKMLKMKSNSIYSACM